MSDKSRQIAEAVQKQYPKVDYLTTIVADEADKVIEPMEKEIARWKDAYENMKAFAESNGLDVTARN